MADDVNKKITIDVEVTTDGQQQINQYTTAFNNLRSTISNLGKPLNDISTSIQSLDKDLAKFSSTGDNAKSKVSELSESFVGWTEVTKVFSKILGDWGIALSAGLSILVNYGPEILKWIGNMLKGTTTLSALNKILKDNKLVMDAVNSSRLEGTKNAQGELVSLKTLYNASQDHNLALKERKKAVAALQDQYPDYFRNISSENILIGKAVQNYTNLANAIIASSRARAAQDILTKNSERQLADEDKLKGLQAALMQKNKELAAAIKQHGEIIEATEKVPNGSSFGTAATDSADDATISRLTDETNTLKKNISDAVGDTKILAKQNKALSQIVGDDIKKNGINIITGLNQANKAGNKLLKSTTKVQAQIFSKTEQIQKDSLTKQLQATYQAYGSEAAAENEHYQDEMNKLQEQLNKKQITKAQAKKAAAQLETDYQTNMSAVIDKFNRQDAEKLQQSQNELAELQIKGIQNATEKQIAELTRQQIEKEQQSDKADAETLDRIKKLNEEIAAIQKTNPGADISRLQTTLNTETAIRDANNKKRVEDEQQTANAIAQITKQDDEAQKEKKDQSAIDGAANPAAKLAAEKQLIMDKYQFEIGQAQGNDQKILKLETERNQKIKALDDKSTKDRQKAELQAAQQVEAAAFSLLSNSIKQQSDSKIAALEKDKAAELSNSSLTSAQKLAINAKYKKQEDQVKAKAFKQEQELSIAQAVINGALAVTKVSAQSGLLAALSVGVVIAETAAEVAKIASQKPPAYAKGGLHYTSDGRGGVLPGYSHTDNTNAYLRSGEGIVVSEAMRDPWARNLVSAINVGFGGRDFSTGTTGRGFAVGGIFTDGGDANRYYNQPVNDNKNLANTIAYQMVNNFPPVYVDVKDINNQQNILAQTINRVNL